MESIDQTPPAGPARRAAAAAIAGAVVAVATAWSCWWLLSLTPAAAADAAAGPAGPLLAVAACCAALVLGRLGLAAAACAGYGFAALVGLGACRPARAACARMAVAASPSALRPLVAVLVAGGITVSTVGTASAASVAAPARSSHVVSVTSSPDGATTRQQLPDPGWSGTWTPARPPAPARRQPDVSMVAATALRGSEAASVVVRRGDTLWGIAARHLGPGASDADIAEQWPRWWRTNRARIGDDPDRLLPGQVLVVPTTGTSR